LHGRFRGLLVALTTTAAMASATVATAALCLFAAHRGFVLLTGLVLGLFIFLLGSCLHHLFLLLRVLVAVAASASAAMTATAVSAARGLILFLLNVLFFHGFIVSFRWISVQ
jgi:hypothetical protein